MRLMEDGAMEDQDEAENWVYDESNNLTNAMAEMNNEDMGVPMNSEGKNKSMNPRCDGLKDEGMSGVKQITP